MKLRRRVFSVVLWGDKGEGVFFMWIELKATMTGLGCIFIVLGVLLPAFMLVLMGIGILLFGDVLIGWIITSNELKPLMDKTPFGHELTVFQELGGGGKTHFINTKKDTLGQRKFRFHNKEAIAIIDGKGMGTMPNGNRFFFSHESYDKNIDPARCTVYAKLPGEDLKETYDILVGDIEKEIDRK
jgi:hypothetical protein